LKDVGWLEDVGEEVVFIADEDRVLGLLVIGKMLEEGYLLE
jgi:hypothetical protein